MVASLDKIQGGKIELGSPFGVGCPGIEASAGGQIVVDQAGEYAYHQRMIVAIGTKIYLDRGGVANDPAGTKEHFCVGRAQAGERDSLKAGNRLSRRVKQHARRESRSDQNLRWSGCCK